MEVQERTLCRIFVGELDRRRGMPAYESIVHEARKFGLAGATVHRGVMGYGERAQVHEAKFLSLSEELPMLIELVDEHDRIMAFLELLLADSLPGLVTLERVQVISPAQKGDSR